jgi:hypothetical protein
MESLGAVYVVHGTAAKREATRSIATLKRHHPAWPVATVGERLAGCRHLGPGTDEGLPGRGDKARLGLITPYDRTLFLDADTRVHGDMSAGFSALERGWDLAMVPSIQYACPLHHLDEEERRYTFRALGDEKPLMLNTGVMWFRKSAAVAALFRAWSEEWAKFERHDQGALLRALDRRPVALWLLGRDYNGGEIIEHLFGRARE